MNDFQICFIICTNDHNKLEDCLTHIGKLEIPDGYEIDLITIEDAASIAEGYQNAMAQSNAKYKIYLHQDVCILNQRMLFEMLDIFLPNPSIGLLGVVGYKRVAQSGIMWESPSGYGELYENRSEEAYCLHKKPFGLYEEVAMIDGVLMCTQYDIPWRTDLLKGWHFYDASCSMEYLHAGYHIVVPKQFETWCIHKCGIPSIKDYDKERLVFVQEYNLKSLTLIRQALEAEEYQQALSQIEAYKSIWEYGEYIAVLESDTLIHLAQYEAARSCIQQGLTYDSNSCELYYMLGEVYELCEQQILARLCYHYALFLCQNPSDSEYFRKNLNRFDQCHTMVSPRIAILLKASRNLEWLTNCIKQIRLYNVSDSYEIILMESDTSEEVHNWIANQQDLTVRICPPQQEGSIYNLGIDAVQDSADIAIIEEGALPLAHSFFNLQMELYANSQIGAVSAARESSIFTDFEAATQYAVLHNSPGHHSEDKIQLSDPIVLIRRSALKQIGWFDTQFSHYFYQIYDLGFRLLQNHFLQKSCAISAYKTMNPNHM
ncbi:MAG: glycosyltransferase family protein, partial [Hungatella sp.]